jgi:hypothetical protein
MRIQSMLVNKYAPPGGRHKGNGIFFAFMLDAVGLEHLLANQYFTRGTYHYRRRVAMGRWIMAKESGMVSEKKQLCVEDIEAQTALELPDRELMLVTVIVNVVDVLRDIDIDIPITVKNNNVAVQVCAAVAAIATVLGTTLGANAIQLTCELPQE